MRKFVKTAGLAVTFVAIAVSSASATIGPAMVMQDGTIGTGSNTGALSGNASSYVPPAFSAGAGGAVKVQCPDVDFKVTSITTNTVSFDASYGPAANCTFAVSGTVLGTAQFDTTGAWSLLGHHALYNSSTGQTTDITVTSSLTKLTIPGLCTLDILHQTNRGITTQNILQNGTATAAATPWGVRVDANVASLTYTNTGCPGLNEHGADGVYTGSIAIANLTGSL